MFNCIMIYETMRLDSGAVLDIAVDCLFLFYFLQQFKCNFYHLVPMCQDVREGQP